jgi:hypothetical protein
MPKINQTVSGVEASDQEFEQQETERTEHFVKLRFLG